MGKISIVWKDGYDCDEMVNLVASRLAWDRWLAGSVDADGVDKLTGLTDCTGSRIRTRDGA